MHEATVHSEQILHEKSEQILYYIMELIIYIISYML